jgi:hypothetical protein
VISTTRSGVSPLACLHNMHYRALQIAPCACPISFAARHCPNAYNPHALGMEPEDAREANAVRLPRR